MRLRKNVTMATVALMAGVIAALPARADAQDHRLRVSFGAATTTGGSDSQMALTGGVGYRFSERLSFDVEGTHFDGPDGRDLPFTIAGAASGIAGGIRFGSQAMPVAGGRGRNTIGSFGPSLQQGFNVLIYPPIQQRADSQTIIATLGLRYEFPVQAGRLVPYVTAGFGAARTEREVEFGPTPLALSTSRPGVQQAPIRLQTEKVTHTGLAGSLGVGASLRVFAQLSLDADARYYRLDNDRSIGRLGGGLSYRF